MITTVIKASAIALIMIIAVASLVVAILAIVVVIPGTIADTNRKIEEQASMEDADDTNFDPHGGSER